MSLFWTSVAGRILQRSVWWFGLLSLFACIWLVANGYTLTRQQPESVLVPIDCKMTA